MYEAEEALGGRFALGVDDLDEARGAARTFPTPESLELRPILESARGG